MWPFKNENPNKTLADSELYAKLLNRITERDADLATIKSKMAILEGDVAHLRGKMSQKLRDLQKEHNQDQEEKDKNDSEFKYL